MIEIEQRYKITQILLLSPGLHTSIPRSFDIMSSLLTETLESSPAMASNSQMPEHWNNWPNEQGVFLSYTYNNFITF